jgi:cytochrome c oxidase assembly protein Cox11
MSLFDGSKTLKRLQNRYRLVIMNDDTYEEVITFKLTRMSVYVVLSTIFVVLIGLTVALVSFTNLKYYLPGYGNQSQRREYIQLKYRTDSLEREMQMKDQYLESIKKVLTGDMVIKKDTTVLKTPSEGESSD